MCGKYSDDCSVLRCRNRLKDRVAAYEDTGLEPQEIERIVDAYGRGRTLRTESAERLEIIREIPTERLREAVEKQVEYEQFMEKWKQVAEIAGAVKKVGAERAAELVEADRDGRCVVLPCKPGETINSFHLYDKNRICIISDIVTSVTTNRHGWTVKTKSKFLPIKESDGNKIAPISQYPYALADYYVGPREAAEAALKGEQDG